MFENKTEATSNVKKLLLSKLTSWKGKDEIGRAHV